MSLQLKQTVKLSQSLVMTPQLQLGLKLLAMNRLELAQTLQTEIVENPVLEEDWEEQIDWESYSEDYGSHSSDFQGTLDADDSERPGFEQGLSREETLEEHLLWQVQMSDMNSIEQEIAVRLIGEIDERGYLDTSESLILKEEKSALAPAPTATTEIETPVLPKPGTLERLRSLRKIDCEPADIEANRPRILELIAEGMGVPVEWIESVRKRIMKLDPIGCLALDLRECMLAQLEALGFDEETIEHTLVSQFLAELENRDYRPIQRRLQINPKELSQAIKVLEKLNPVPAKAFGNAHLNPIHIVPDVYVVPSGEDYAIVLNDNGMPKLRLSRFYIDQAKSKKGDPSQAFIKEKIRSAIGLIRSIHQRQKTIVRVMESIVKFQRSWFDGAAPMRPLVLRMVADDIGVHESTVSRVTSGKYVHTPRGIFELKYFFSSSIQTMDGQSVAGEAAKEAVKKLIAAENPQRPLSDFDIVERLKNQDIQIARRTVAKYRDMLGILPSSKRRASQIHSS